LAQHAGEDALTPREIDVLRLIAAGNPNKEIAAQLSIAEETAKSHVARILDKLQANDRTHALTIGLQRGIIELPFPPKAGFPHSKFGRFGLRTRSRSL
jgi:DNA-binding NarL/FixJ family response regulator